MTAACDVPCVNNRAASNRRASNAALRRCPCCGVVMPQHRMVPDDNHHFISRDSLAGCTKGSGWSTFDRWCASPVCSNRLLDHFVRPPQQRLRYRQPDRLGGLDVDDQLALCGPLDEEVGGLSALEDLVGVLSGAAPHVQDVHTVRDETTRFHILPEREARRKPVLQ